MHRIVRTRGWRILAGVVVLVLTFSSSVQAATLSEGTVRVHYWESFDLETGTIYTEDTPPAAADLRLGGGGADYSLEAVWFGEPNVARLKKVGTEKPSKSKCRNVAWGNAAEYLEPIPRVGVWICVRTGAHHYSRMKVLRRPGQTDVAKFAYRTWS
jgi:hypothetical protein